MNRELPKEKKMGVLTVLFPEHNVSVTKNDGGKVVYMGFMAQRKETQGSIWQSE